MFILQQFTSNFAKVNVKIKITPQHKMFILKINHT